MCDGMRIDRRLVIIGVILIVLSMTMATQYTVTKVGWSVSVVHPSDADIRFIAYDKAADNIYLLRVLENTSGDQDMTIPFGNISVGQNKTYTAAFGIVNEEEYAVNITHVNVSADSGTDYIQLWFHGAPNLTAENDATSVYAWDGAEWNDAGSYSASTTIWQLAAGDGDRTTINGTTTTGNSTYWNEQAHIQYATIGFPAVNQTDDYVWVQVSLNIPDTADTTATFNGQIWIHTSADTG